MKKRLLLFFIPLLLTGIAKAQTPHDAVMMEKREICFAFGYDQSKWDQYWEGTTLINNENIGTFTRNTFMPMVVYGITGKLNVLLSTPYVKTESTGGQLAGVQGFQDINIGLKYEAYKKDFGKHRVSALVVAQFSTP